MTKIKKLTEEDVNPDTLNGQTLAYLGDAVYEVIIRRHLVKGGIVKPQVLQREATHYVSAKAQAALVTKMQDEEMLTDDELAAFRRGRNAKSHTKAKNTSLKTYQLPVQSCLGHSIHDNQYLPYQFQRPSNRVSSVL